MVEFSTEYILFEEYKLFVNAIEQQSTRRQQMNNFYVTVLSGILLGVSFVLEKGIIESSVLSGLILLMIGLLGSSICIIWRINIKSYKQLAASKFEVIMDIETKLPYPLFTKEWDILQEGTAKGKYKELSQVEKLVPVLMLVPYTCVIIMGIILIA